MRTTIELLVIVALLAALFHEKKEYWTGFDAGVQHTTQKYEGIISYRVEEGIQDARRVMAIRIRDCK